MIIFEATSKLWVEEIITMKREISILTMFSIIVLTVVFIGLPRVEAFQNEHISILSRSHFYDSSGSLHVVGEVKNVGDSSVKHVNVSVVCYDASNNTVAFGSKNVSIDVLLPGQKSPFEIVFEDAHHMSHYEASVSSYETTNIMPYRNLKIVSHNSSRDETGRLHIVGEVENTGNRNATGVEVIAAFYDEMGTLIAMNTTYIAPANLEPSRVGEFEIILCQRVGDLESYDLQIQCGRASSSITCNLSPSPTILIGTNVLIYGDIDLPIATSVAIKYSMDNGTTWNDLTTKESFGDGSYSLMWFPSMNGTYMVRTIWSGNAEYVGAISQPAPLIVNKVSSQIWCQLSSTKIAIGESVTISGLISPVHPATDVTIFVGANEVGLDVWDKVKTDLGGGYSCIWTPPSAGTYYVKATWLGDRDTEGAESDIVLLSVVEKDGNDSLYLVYVIFTVAVIGVAGAFYLLRRSIRLPHLR